MDHKLSIGLARIHKEPGERRDFLPRFVAWLEKTGARVVMEYGYGSGIALVEADYLQLAPSATFAARREVYQQDCVLVLRYPDDEDIRLMRPGACLISMVHLPTRPGRVVFLRSLGIEAISLDSVKDDSGRRVVENLQAVGWNGIEAAFKVLRTTYPDPGFGNPNRPPIKVTLLGAGAVGTHVVQAATRYGNEKVRAHMVAAGIPGVMVTTVDYDVTPHHDVMRELLAGTDILVDATQRPDPSLPVITNDWLVYLPEHAVILDLSVDPYECATEITSIKGIEGIPQGNLDQYIFAPDDPAFDLLPKCFPTQNRRFTVSCYSWPGIYPVKCMGVYGRQIWPLLHVLIDKDGTIGIDPQGSFFERAIARALLSRWPEHKDHP